MKLLVTVEDFTESNMIKALLNDNGIYVLACDLGGGGVMKVYLGYSVFGQELYVSEDDYPMASELVTAFFNRTPKDDDTDTTDDGKKKHPFGCF